MSELKEKVNQLREFIGALNLSDIRDQKKMADAIVNAFDAIADEFSKLEAMHLTMQEQVNIIDEDLGTLEDEIYEEGYEDEFVEVICPHCEKNITFVEEEIIDADEVECPACHKTFEIEWECECDSDDCDCGCNHDHNDR